MEYCYYKGAQRNPERTHSSDGKDNNKYHECPSAPEPVYTAGVLSFRACFIACSGILEIGALPEAPKKAPACRTETTLDETWMSLLFLIDPSALTRPKWVSKKGWETTPPAMLLDAYRNLQQLISIGIWWTYVSYPYMNIPKDKTNASTV